MPAICVSSSMVCLQMKDCNLNRHIYSVLCSSVRIVCLANQFCSYLSPVGVSNLVVQSVSPIYQLPLITRSRLYPVLFIFSSGVSRLIIPDFPGISFATVWRQCFVTANSVLLASYCNCLAPMLRRDWLRASGVLLQPSGANVLSRLTPCFWRLIATVWRQCFVATDFMPQGMSCTLLFSSGASVVLPLLSRFEYCLTSCRCLASIILHSRSHILKFVQCRPDYPSGASDHLSLVLDDLFRLSGCCLVPMIRFDWSNVSKFVPSCPNFLSSVNVLNSSLGFCLAFYLVTDWRQWFVWNDFMFQVCLVPLVS